MVVDGVNLTACRSRSAGCDMRSEKSSSAGRNDSKTSEHPRSNARFGAEPLVNINIIRSSCYSRVVRSRLPTDPIISQLWRQLQPRFIITLCVPSAIKIPTKKQKNPVRPDPDGQNPLARAVDLGSDPRTEQPTVAGDMVNKSVSGDLLPKWHAGDNIHALPAFTFAVAPGHPSITRNHGAVIFLRRLNCVRNHQWGFFVPTTLYFFKICPRICQQYHFIIGMHSSILRQSRTKTSRWKLPNFHQSKITP